MLKRSTRPRSRPTTPGDARLATPHLLGHRAYGQISSWLMSVGGNTAGTVAPKNCTGKCGTGLSRPAVEGRSACATRRAFRATQGPRRRGKEARRDAKPGLRPRPRRRLAHDSASASVLGRKPPRPTRGRSCWSSGAGTREIETGRTRDCDREPDAESRLRWAARAGPCVPSQSPSRGCWVAPPAAGLDSAGWSARYRPRSRRPERRQAVLGAACIGLPRGRATGWRSARCGGPPP